MNALRDPEGVLIAAMDIEDVWQLDLLAEAKLVFGTTDVAHPAVWPLFENVGILAVQEVPRAETENYGVVDGRSWDDNLFHVSGIVERPASEHAPSNLAVIGRYILPSRIFHHLEQTPNRQAWRRKVPAWKGWVSCGRQGHS